jgi:hypothetical protein
MKILILLIVPFWVYGQCILCNIKEPETTWTDADNYTIHFAVHDTIEIKYDTSFVDFVDASGIIWKKPLKIDTFYCHTDFDLKQYQKGKIKSNKIERIIIK